jgi:hypothetical protein
VHTPAWVSDNLTGIPGAPAGQTWMLDARQTTTASNRKSCMLSEPLTPVMSASAPHCRLAKLGHVTDQPVMAALLARLDVLLTYGKHSLPV